MYKQDHEKEEQNFWISYADLMAGLLFVFILVVGAIVVRYVYVQQDLAQKREALGLSEQALESKNKKVQELRRKLHKSIEDLAKMKKEKESFVKNLTLQANEVAKLKALILDYEEGEKAFQTEISSLQSDLNETQNKLLYETGRADILEQNLSAIRNIMILKDEEIAALGKKLLHQSIEHQKLVDELNITKVKIKNLTGIRIKVVSKLKEKLGDSIQIDPKSGAMRFSSNILFNQGAYKLKPSAKKELKAILQKYILTLLLDKEIRNYIEGITIEGHTDSVGGYLYNLALSQKRALEVMKFLYESDPSNRELYSKYLSASGRSYADLIYDNNGNEDKSASRRIEIKFRIKNEKAIKELEKFLNR
jgi:chemotaxis protein MotB